jgi:citrate synthase
MSLPHFRKSARHKMLHHQHYTKFMHRRAAEAYHMLLAGMSAFASTDLVICGNRHKQKPSFHSNLDTADDAILRTISYLSATVALVYCHKHNKTFTQPQPGHSLIENLLLMMGFHNSSGDGPNLEIVGYFNKLWIIFCDFEMCHSTAAVLHAGSSLTDPISCVISGIVSAHGPLHFGAVELSYEALEQIGSPGNVDAFLDAVRNKKSRLFGYGHRTFETRDPRPALIKEVMGDYMAANSASPLLQTAFALDEAAQTDPYFVKRNLHVNVDLYASFPYIAMLVRTLPLMRDSV